MELMIKSESPTEIEPMASKIPVGALTTELRENFGELGHLNCCP